MGVLNYNAQVLYPYYKELDDKVKSNNFIIDKSGCKIVELLAPRIEFDLNKVEDGYIDFDARKSPRNYVLKEKEWYNSHSLNIKLVEDVTIWQNVANENREINSNYGYLVYDKGNFSQFSHTLHTLETCKDSRQAVIIYTRPSIQLEHNDLNGSDFICTNFQHFFIRDNKLYCVVSMRSNDCIFGLFNDLPWFVNVCKDMYNKLLKTYENLELGSLVFIPNSFHCYERHFNKLSEIVN